MKASGRWASKGIVVAVTVAVIAVLVLSMMVSTTAAVTAANARTSSTPAAAVPTSVESNSASISAKPFYDEPATGGGPHPGVIEGYEVAAQGATTEDPAVAYDTVSYEPILNVYQTLVAYNGSSTANFVPELSTCVPGLANGVSSTPSVSCQSIYGESLVGSNSQGQPEYYTFPIDPGAHFYDPSTGASWKVYPSDVMFSYARTMGFADLPGVATTPGWIQTQAMLPIGDVTWDGGIHYPFNNTPNNVLDSMLINDTTLPASAASADCPASAMAASGCVTFIAFGGGVDWPFFLDLVADPLGGGVVPCGWFTYVDAGVPGYPGTAAAKGDGPCFLPGGVTSTNQTAFANAVAAMAPTSWDAFEELMFNHPAVQPNVRAALVGSGPYYTSAFSLTAGYTLEANPAYQQPVGCKGVGGGCEPAVGQYIPKVVIVYESTDTEGIEQAVAGQTDYFEFDPTETSTILQLASEGKIGIQYAKTLSIFFFPFNLDFNATGEAAIDPYAGEINVGPTFFASNTVRELLAHSYPYTTNLDTVWTVDGVSYGFNFGGAIPVGMANYYPSNISWPYQGGDPSPSNTSVNSAEWWWTQGTDPTSPYYDSALAACTASTPCKFPIVGSEGEPQSSSFDAAIANFISDVETITGNALQPYVFYQSFTDRVTESLASAGSNPMPFYQLAWAPDYPDPTDYMVAMYGANGSYTLGDSTYQELEVNPAYNLASCGHTSGSWADLVYWANYSSTVGTPIPTGCQGPAYGAMLTWMTTAASLAPGPYRVLIYNEVEHIENQLALYVWAEQQNTVLTYAKWINPSGINQNVMIGGGMDQTWYTWSYATSVGTVYFNETGLTSGTSWSVHYAGTTYTNSTGSSIAIPGQTVGNYSYSVSYVTGYTQTTTVNGSVSVVPPASNAIAITYAPVVCSPTTCGNLTFGEGGLQSGTNWTVVVAGLGSVTTNTAYATLLSVPLSGSPYTFGVETTVGYTTTVPTNGQGTTPVVASGTSVPVFFAGVLFTTYPITFASSGLGGGTWSVKLNGYNNTTSSASIVFWEANNTYSFAVSTTSGLTPIAPLGQVTLSGVAVTVNVPFTAHPLALTFTETGLATGVAWGVTVAGNGTNPGGGTTGGFTVPSTTTTAVFMVAAGVWNYSVLPLQGYNTTNSAGQVTVSAATGVTIPFAVVTYSFTVFEVGLPSGASWTVNATFTYPDSTETGTTAVTSAATTLVLYLPNGTATYTVTGPATYSSPPGSTTITAAPQFGVAVFTVTPVTYTVTFKQSGVPTGSTWNVSVNGVNEGGTGATLVFNLPNGTYTYVVVVPSGYTASPSGGALSVVGAATSVSVTVATTPTPTTTTSSSGLSTLAYELIGVFVVLAIIFLITTLYFARRKPPATPPPQSWQGTGGGSSGDTMSTESKEDTSSTPPSS